MSAKEPASPHFLVVGKNSSKAITSSVSGNTTEMIAAAGPISGDSERIILNLCCSENLLTPVYTNSRMNSAEIISMIIEFRLGGFMQEQ